MFLLFYHYSEVSLCIFMFTDISWKLAAVWCLFTYISEKNQI